MSNAKRPNFLISLVLLALTIAVGAHVSGAPLFVVKVLAGVFLFFLYGLFAVRLVSVMQIGSTATRGAIGFLLGAATVYLTWAVRIPAFSGWETPFTADPSRIWHAVVDRAGSLTVSKGFGSGTSTEGPSWLMLGTYLLEAISFVGVMVLCALLAGPEEPAAETAQSVEETLADAA